MKSQEESGGGQANGPPLRLYDPGFKSKKYINIILLSLFRYRFDLLFQPQVTSSDREREGERERER